MFKLDIKFFIKFCEKEVYIVHKINGSPTLIHTSQLKIQSLYTLKYFLTTWAPQTWIKPQIYSSIKLWGFTLPFVVQKNIFLFLLVNTPL
jgi:hypothetical protein